MGSVPILEVQLMLLAHVVLSAAVAANSPSRSEPLRPCADISVLCRMSPFFCPAAYPQGLEPCWPTDSRQTRDLPGGRASGATSRTASVKAAPSAGAGV